MIDSKDETIVRLVQAGDSDQFGELISRYEAKLIRYARKFFYNQDTVKDLVQDTFIKAYTNLQSFDPKQRFSPWLYRIAHNTFINEIRRQSRFPFDLFAVDTLLPQLRAKETADGVVLAEEIKQAMERVLDQLPVKYREVIVLHYYEEFSYAEISDVLEIPVTTVGVRLSRARTKIEALLKTHNL